jgi:hypothetical protein
MLHVEMWRCGDKAPLVECTVVVYTKLFVVAVEINYDVRSSYHRHCSRQTIGAKALQIDSTVANFATATRSTKKSRKALHCSAYHTVNLNSNRSSAYKGRVYKCYTCSSDGRKHSA